MSEALAIIVLQVRSKTRHFLLALARELRARHRNNIHLYVGNAQEAAYYRGLDGDGLFACITIDGQPSAGAKAADVDEANAIIDAATWEEHLGYDFTRVTTFDLQSVVDATKALERSLSVATDLPVAAVI